MSCRCSIVPRFPRPRSRRPTVLRLGGVALAMLLAGCASAPPRPPATGLVNGQQGCQAPPPNLNRAYNRPYTVLGRSYTPLRTAAGYDAIGTASWYGWESGSTTAMGTRFNPRLFSAASRVLPLPSCVQVTNLDNGRSALVLINDRGPFVDSRILDLSYGAAQALGVTRTGTATVRIVGLPDGAPASPGEGETSYAAAATSAAVGAGVNALPPQAQPQTQFPAPGGGIFAQADSAEPASNTSAAAATGVEARIAPGRGRGAAAAPPAAAGSTGVGPTVGTASDWPGLAGPAGANATASPAAASTPPPMIEQVLPPLAPPPAEAPVGAGSNGAAAAPAAIDPTLPLPALAGSPSTRPPAADLPAGTVAPSLPGPAQTYVQTGAFTDPGHAEAEQARLRAAGIGPVLIVPGVVRGQTFYRVQVGPISGAQPDPALLRQLRGLGITVYNLVQQ